MLSEYSGNSRTHTAAQVAQIAASIQEFGFTNPVLIDGAGEIIAGHGRVAAAVSLGIDDVPCIRLDHLTDQQKRAYVIADNKIAINAGWDDGKLAEEINRLMDDGFDISIIGFSDSELEALNENADMDAAALMADDLMVKSERAPQTDQQKEKRECPHCGGEI